MKTVEQLAHEAWPEAWRYDTNDDFVTFTFEELQRFHDLAIAQYRESLLAGVGDLTDKHDHPEPHTMKWTQLEMNYINNRVSAAVAIERERCAKVCDEYAKNSSNPMNFAENCAAAIRGQR